jgi:hypothetical protein
MKTCYYAHSMAIMNTKQEARDIDLLGRLGYLIINPFDDLYQAAYQKDGIDSLKPVVWSCDVLAFRSHLDMAIGAGVGREIEWAIEKDIPVFELPSMMLSRIISVAETKEYLKETGQR